MKIILGDEPKFVRYREPKIGRLSKCLTNRKVYKVKKACHRGPYGWVRIYNDVGLSENYSAKNFSVAEEPLEDLSSSFTVDMNNYRGTH